MTDSVPSHSRRRGRPHRHQWTVMLALLTRLDDAGRGASVPHGRLAKELDLPRMTVKRNLARLAQDGLPVERTPEGWRATLDDPEKVDKAVALLLSDRSRWGELMASRFPRVLSDAYLRYRLEGLLQRVLTSKAVKARITADAIQELVVVSDAVPRDSLLREELPKAVLEAVRSAGDARELRDRLHALIGDSAAARLQLPPDTSQALVPMLRESPALLQASLDPRPFGFSAAPFDTRHADDPSGRGLVLDVLATVCTVIRDADALLTPPPEGPPPERPAEVARPGRGEAEVRRPAGTLRAFARRLSRSSAPVGPRVAQAALAAEQFRELADAMSRLLASTEGFDLRIRLRLELSGTSPPPRDVVERANRILKDVDDALELR